MKNIIISFVVALMALSSCSTYQYTARQVSVEKQNIMVTPTIVDVQVDYSKRINGVSRPCKTKQEAIEEARYMAITNNKIDIVVDPIIKVDYRMERYQVTLTGFAGYYINSRSLYDDIRQTKDLSKEDIKKYLILHHSDVLQYMDEKGNTMNFYQTTK